MESKTIIEVTPEKEEIQPKEESNYLEIEEIPYDLYQFLSSENCNVQNICRICLSINGEVLYPLIPAKENTILADIFTNLTAVQLLPDEGLPNSVCELCQSAVLQYYEFKLKCERSDCILRSILKGDFITKETTDGNVYETVEKVIKENNEDTQETDLDTEVQYLENFDENDEDPSSIYIDQKPAKKRKRNSNISGNVSRRTIKKRVKTKQPEKRKRTYICIHCSKEYPKAKLLQLHVRKKHRIVKPTEYTCKHCLESFDSQHDLTIHSSLHGTGNPWKCNQCEKEFTSITTLRRHIRRHMENKPHVCEICTKSFVELYALKRHERVHTGEQLEKKYACEHCDKRYSEKGYLMAHISSHTGIRPCECLSCGKRFASARLLASHTITHTNDKPFACSYCNKSFRHESTRNIHHRTHTGEKPYVCSVCGKSFIQSSNLTLHMRTHTGERPYVCTVCNYKFTSGSSLKSHERIHTGERPYSCQVCGKRFARKNFSAHMRQHTGDKPFACSACPKKFVNASRLRDHCRVHTGEKPYECAYCTCRFGTKRHLVYHLKMHEKSKKYGKLDSTKIQKVTNNPGKITDKEENGNVEKVITESTSLEVPLEMTGDFILQDENDIKTNILIIDNNETSINNDIALNTEIDSEVDYGSDMNLVTVNEGGVSISASALEGTTVKLYQLDQSLVQIHSTVGQVTISKITSKMTANF